MEQIFRGSFRVTDGDTFAQPLVNPLSTLFRDTAVKYKRAIVSWRLAVTSR